MKGAADKNMERRNSERKRLGKTNPVKWKRRKGATKEKMSKGEKNEKGRIELLENERRELMDEEKIESGRMW